MKIHKTEISGSRLKVSLDIVMLNDLHVVCGLFAPQEPGCGG